MGIFASQASQATIEHVSVSDCSAGGMAIGTKSIVRSCNANNNLGYGMLVMHYSTVTDCNANQNGISGLTANSNAVVTGCHASDNADAGMIIGGASLVTGCIATNNGDAGFDCASRATVSNHTAYGNNGGFLLDDASTITGCTASDQFTGPGIWVKNECTVANCNASGNPEVGIKAGSDCHIVGNTCADNAFSGGIYITGIANRIDSNHVSGNSGYGIRVEGADNLVIRDSARDDSSGNFAFPTGSEYGQIIQYPGNAFVATNHWANFAF